MNLPNKLSLLRIFMIPVFVACYFVKQPYMPFVAVGVFVLAAFTDFLDGYIARKYNLVSDLGKLLDPIADKLLITAALFVIVASNPLDEFFGILLACCSTVIVGRELFISAVRQIATTKGIVIQANWWGKIKTVAQDVSIPLLIVLQAQQYNSSLSAEFFEIIKWIGLAIFAVATLLTIISGIIYIIDNRCVFAEVKK